MEEGKAYQRYESLLDTIKNVMDINHELLVSTSSYEVSYKELDRTDQVIVFLFRKTLEQMMGIYLLLAHRNGHSTESLGRDLMEVFAHLNFILEKDTKRRALSYYFQHFKSQNSKLEDIKRTTKLSDEYALIVDKKLENNHKRISSIEFEEIYYAWIRESKRDKHPKYFNLFLSENNKRGLTSFTKKYIPKASFINPINYHKYSTQVHGLNALEAIEAYDDDNMALTSIVFLREDTLDEMNDLILTIGIVAGKLVSTYFGEPYVEEYERQVKKLIK